MSIINKEYELNDKQLEKIAEYKKELDKKNRIVYFDYIKI